MLDIFILSKYLCSLYLHAIYFDIQVQNMRMRIQTIHITNDYGFSFNNYDELLTLPKAFSNIKSTDCDAIEPDHLHRYEKILF